MKKVMTNLAGVIGFILMLGLAYGLVDTLLPGGPGEVIR